MSIEEATQCPATGGKVGRTQASSRLSMIFAACRNVLVCLLLAALLGLVVRLGLLVNTARQELAALPPAVNKQIDATRKALQDQATETRDLIDRQLTETRRQVLALVDRQARSVQDNAMLAIEQRGDAIDKRLDAAIAVLDARAGEFTSDTNTAATAMAATEQDLKPAMASAAAATKDAQDSWDAMYPDVLALVDSADVAARGVGETAEAVGKVAPSVADSFKTTAKAVSTEAEALTKPKHWYERMFGPVYTVARTVLLFF